MFAKIWAALNPQYILTPILQRIHAIRGLGQQKQVMWHDIWCVPDYDQFFFGFLQPITRAFKIGDDDWSQLQWIVESKDDGRVSTSYRAYASDDVVELWEKKRWQREKLPVEYANTITDLVPVQVCLHGNCINVSCCLKCRYESVGAKEMRLNMKSFGHGVAPPQPGSYG